MPRCLLTDVLPRRRLPLLPGELYPRSQSSVLRYRPGEFGWSERRLQGSGSGYSGFGPVVLVGVGGAVVGVGLLGLGYA